MLLTMLWIRGLFRRKEKPDVISIEPEVSLIIAAYNEETFIEKKMFPIVLRHAISGVAHINTEDPVLDDPLALAMLIDVFSERGYHADVDLHKIEVPEKVDLKTGVITCRVKKVFLIHIRFQGSEIRRG